MSNKMLDLLMKDFDNEIDRIYAHDNAPSVYKTDNFKIGYTKAFLLQLLSELPDTAREDVIDKIVDRVIFMRSRQPEYPLNPIKEQAA